MKKVFISYSRKDKVFAERLARELSDAGLEIWIDFRQIKGGEDWRKAITSGISGCDIFITCLSPDSVSSEWVRREIFLARAQHKYIIPIMVSDCFELMPEYDETKELLDVQIIDFQTSYEKSFRALLNALPNISLFSAKELATIDPETIKSPFKGLEAFQQTDAGVFFGREDVIDKMLAKAQVKGRAQFLAVVGASGSGKSSLVRAGFIPAIRAGKLPYSDEWLLSIFNPGADPLRELATRLLPLINRDVSHTEIENFLEKDPFSLHQIAKSILAKSDTAVRILLVIDQFEEVFTQASQTERDKFLNLLYQAVTATETYLMVVITMRADFFDRLSGYPDFASLFEQENLVIVTEMSPPSLRRSIEEPAKAVGLIYEDGLTDLIMDDIQAQPSSLPLLQYALKELFLLRQGRMLTLKAYREIGGVTKALAQHAESIYQNLVPDQQEMMRRILLQLVEITETGEATRRRLDRRQLEFQTVSPEKTQQVIDLLTGADSRLLTTSRQITSNTQDEEPLVWLEISHEALIREWGHFKSWIADNLENLRYGSDLLKIAQDWDRSKHDSAYLLAGSRLERAEEWLVAADATELQRQFILASLEMGKRRQQVAQKRQERELALQKRAANRLRYLVVMMMIFLIGASLLSLFAFRERNNAQRQAQVAEQAEETSAANEATAVVAQRTSAAGEALARTQVSAQQTQAVITRLQDEDLLRRDWVNRAELALDNNDPVLGLALALEAISNTDFPPPEAEAIFSEAVYAAPRHIFDGHQGSITQLAISSDNTLMVSGDDQGQLMVWSLATREILHQMQTEGSIRALSISPDKQVILTSTEDLLIAVWDLNTGELLRYFNDEGLHHSDLITSLAISPDGNKVLSTSRDGSLMLWDLVTGNALYQRGEAEGGHTAAINDGVFSPDGKWILTASDDTTLILWNTETGDIIFPFIGHTAPVTAVAFNPDGSEATSVSANGVAIRWDAPRAEQWASYEGREVNWSDVIAAGAHEVLIIQDLGESFMLQEGDTYIRAFSLRDNTWTTAAWLEDQQQILMGSDSGKIVLWDQQKPQVVREYTGLSDSWIATMTFHPDGQHFLVGDGDGIIRILDITGATQPIEFTGHQDSIRIISISPDGNQVLSFDEAGKALLWDFTTGIVLQSYEVTDVFSSLSTAGLSFFDPTGTWFLLPIIGSNEELAGFRLIDRHNFEEIKRLTLNSQFGTLISLAISSDGEYIAASTNLGEDLLYNQLWLWQTSTGNSRLLLDQENIVVFGLSFNHLEPKLTTSAIRFPFTLENLSSDISIWNVPDGSLDRQLQDASFFNVLSEHHPKTNNLINVSRFGEVVVINETNMAVQQRFETLSTTDEVYGNVEGAILHPYGDYIMLQWEGEDRLTLVRLEELPELREWAFQNRFIQEFNCEEREAFQLSPCEVDIASFPSRTPYPTLPASATPTPSPTLDLAVISPTATLDPEAISYFGTAQATPIYNEVIPAGERAFFNVVIAYQDLPRGFVLTYDNITGAVPAIGYRLWPVSIPLPENSYTDIEQLVDHTVRSDIPRESLILSSQLYTGLDAVSPSPTWTFTPDPNSSDRVVQTSIPFVTATPVPAIIGIEVDRVEFPLPLLENIRYPAGLQAGDYIYIYITIPNTNLTSAQTTRLPSDALIIKIAPEQLILAIRNDEIVALSDALANQYAVTLAVRSAADQAISQVEDVNWDYIVESYTISIPEGAEPRP